MLKKDFKYGDLWPGTALQSAGKHGVVKVRPERYLKNRSYLNFINMLGYAIYLDYDFNGVARTEPDHHRIIVNANYTDNVISALLRHELGHLMLFNGNQFSTVRKDSLRSIIARRLYTSDNVGKYGIDQLFMIENIIQDIVIETMSNGNCVCNEMYQEYGGRAGVKHLRNLDQISLITREVSKNLLVPLDKKRRPDSPMIEASTMTDLLKTMIKDLEETLETERDDVEKQKNHPIGSLSRENKRKLNNERLLMEKLNDAKSQLKHLDDVKKKKTKKLNENKRRLNDKIKQTVDEINKIKSDNAANPDDRQKSTTNLENSVNMMRRQLKKLNESRSALDSKMKSTRDKIKKIQDKLSDELKDTRSQIDENKIRRELDESEKKLLEDKQEAVRNDEELLDQLKKTLKQQGMHGSGDSDNAGNAERNQNSNLSDGMPGDGDSGNGEGNADGQSSADATDGIGNGNSCDDGKMTLEHNTTDHLYGPDQPENHGPGNRHSFDIGLPRLSNVSREDKLMMRSFTPMKLLRSYTRRTPIHVHQNVLNNPVEGEQIKLPTYESTYFKSNKREIKPSDMLKGHRKKRYTGVNVLIGLDVSGSMVRAWGAQYKKISDIINNLKTKLDIKDVIYFMYNSQLIKFSNDINDMNPYPHGGNAFAYVYAQIMERIPVLLRNEIILVTDCGDNIGFKLDDVCIGDVDGDHIINHVSVIDTEPTAFYAKSIEFDEQDWSIYPYDDENLEDEVSGDISNLMAG